MTLSVTVRVTLQLTLIRTVMLTEVPTLALDLAQAALQPVRRRRGVVRREHRGGKEPARVPYSSGNPAPLLPRTQRLVSPPPRVLFHTQQRRRCRCSMRLARRHLPHLLPPQSLSQPYRGALSQQARAVHLQRSLQARPSRTVPLQPHSPRGKGARGKRAAPVPA